MRKNEVEVGAEYALTSSVYELPSRVTVLTAPVRVAARHYEVTVRVLEVPRGSARRVQEELSVPVRYLRRTWTKQLKQAAEKRVRAQAERDAREAQRAWWEVARTRFENLGLVHGEDFFVRGREIALYASGVMKLLDGDLVGDV